MSNLMSKTLRTLSFALVISAAATSTALAGERLVDGILGGAAGGLVLGPVGLVGGAIIGATAGPGMARSWGFKRHTYRHRNRRVSVSQR